MTELDVFQSASVSSHRNTNQLTTNREHKWLPTYMTNTRRFLQCSLSFLKPVRAYIFFCATVYLNSTEFAMTCMKCVQKQCWRVHLCVLQGFLCALVSQPVCECTRAQHRGN